MSANLKDDILKAVSDSRKLSMQNVYVLTFQIGISSGYRQLIGIYETREKAEEILEKHMQKHYHNRNNYSLNKVKLNKEVNVVFAEW